MRAGGVFPADTEFGLTTAQEEGVRQVLEAVARKKTAQMYAEMREAQAQLGERHTLRFSDGNGGECRLMIHPMSYHYWGNRLGYECWDDPQFLREYWRDNPEARVKNVAENPTVIVAGSGGLAASGKKRFSKTYPAAAAAMAAALTWLCAGCVHLPDTWNYTIQLDHQTGETSSYMGVSGPITYPGEKK